MKKPKIILASRSPRRKELLAQICNKFQVEPALYRESLEGRTARGVAIRCARGKAREIACRFPNDVVIGADTVVSFEGSILGKPHTNDEAKRMLRMLSGRAHIVYTGVCVLYGEKKLECVVGTRVVFNVLSNELIESYVESGLPLDRAGAYGIQDGYPLVKLYEGSYTNIVGLPVEETRELLEEILKDSN